MADPAMGAKSTVVIDSEASWGVAKGTVDGKQIGVLQSSIVATQELIRNTSITGTFNQFAPVLGKKASSGNLNFIPNVTMLPHWQMLLCGNLTTTGAGDPYTHVSKVTDDGPGSNVIETYFNIGGTDRFATAAGCRIARLTIPIDPVGFLTFNNEMAAKSVTINTSAYDASATDWYTAAPLHHLQLASADVKIGGSQVGYINKGSINIDCKLFTDDYRVGASGNRGSLVAGLYEIGGSISLVLDTTDVLTLITSTTATSLSLTWTAGANRTFKIDLDEVYIQNTSPVLNNDGPVMFDCQFVAAYDSVATTSMTMTTVNGTAGTVYT